MNRRILNIILTTVTLFCIYIICYVGLGWLWALGIDENYERINQVLLNLSYSYIAAFIFYILIEYIPEKIAAQKALNICKADLVDIYLKMSEQIAIVSLYCRITKPAKSITISDLRNMVHYHPEHNHIYYKASCSINGVKRNDLTKGVVIFSDDLYNLSQKIVDKINRITKLPTSSNLDLSLLEILSNIASCSFIKKCKTFDDPVLNNIEHDIHNFDEEFYAFLKLYLALNKYNFDKYTYVYDSLTKEEIEAMERERNHVMETITRTGRNFQNQKFYKNNIEYKIRNGQLIR